VTCGGPVSWCGSRTRPRRRRRSWSRWRRAAAAVRGGSVPAGLARVGDDGSTRWCRAAVDDPGGPVDPARGPRCARRSLTPRRLGRAQAASSMARTAVSGIHGGVDPPTWAHQPRDGPSDLGLDQAARCSSPRWGSPGCSTHTDAAPTTRGWRAGSPRRVQQQERRRRRVLNWPGRGAPSPRTGPASVTSPTVPGLRVVGHVLDRTEDGGGGHHPRDGGEPDREREELRPLPGGRRPAARDDEAGQPCPLLNGDTSTRSSDMTASSPDGGSDTIGLTRSHVASTERR
jgi:hypothetical protein